MIKIFKNILVLIVLLTNACFAASAKDKSGVSRLLSKMTLDEKIGQLNQLPNNRLLTGPQIMESNTIADIKNGKVGSLLNVITLESAILYQDAAMQSRLKIPLLFGYDVIHGMKTIFPIPLGEAASFDLDLMQRTASAAAFEASAYGINWVFAPMVDVTRDARWGRVMEGAGEDTWYGSLVAEARVSGFQGKNYTNATTVLACAKHFAGYGASVAGKDYNSVEISDNTLHQVYLPPFKSAIDANVATLMNGFTDLNGIPVTASKYLVRDILKKKWKFSGFVVSDWNSIGELIKHRVAENGYKAAEMAMKAGSDMDMCSLNYSKYLKELVLKGVVSEKLIDDAVLRILTKKQELGLFDDPYKYLKRKHDSNKLLYRSLAREAGCKSIVLLKNNNNLLPVGKNIKSVALVGPLMKSNADMNGAWAAQGDPIDVISPYDGLKQALPNTEINYFEGYDIETNNILLLNDIEKNDLIIVAVGERANQSGEARSKVDINVNHNQQMLVEQLKKTGKPVITLIMGGRPLIFNEINKSSDAILFTWWLGSEAGNSIADVLTGSYNPSAKLPMTFPAAVGQCPIYYNYKSTGRPWINKDSYTSGYIDIENKPAYPFGFGLSYTTFETGSPQLSKERYSFSDTIIVSAKIKNTGTMKGKETVQLYLQDEIASVTRPVIEMCGFAQVELTPSEEKMIRFKLTSKDLGFYNSDNQYITEPGKFRLFVGNSSDNLKSVSFELIK